MNRAIKKTLTVIVDVDYLVQFMKKMMINSATVTITGKQTVLRRNGMFSSVTPFHRLNSSYLNLNHKMRSLFTRTLS